MERWLWNRLFEQSLPVRGVLREEGAGVVRTAHPRVAFFVSTSERSPRFWASPDLSQLFLKGKRCQLLQ